MPADFRPNRDTELIKTESTIKLVDDSSSEEHLDTLSSLPQAVLRHLPSFLTIKSSSSRSNSIKSLCRPGSSSSLTASNFPKWARLYYFSGETPLQSPLLALSDGSRPPTATRPGSPSRQAPAALTRPRSRPYRATPPLHPQQKLIMNHPADPRSHWKRGPEGNQRTLTDQLPGTSYSAMSPHLHPDKGQNGRRNLWKAPSVDSTAEPLLGRRNIQKYSFCFGFIFPLIWFMAAFLPLPNRPPTDKEAFIYAPGVEFGLQVRFREFEERRYENARWWRRLNRCMIPVGIAILVLVITLATLSTTHGLS